MEQNLVVRGVAFEDEIVRVTVFGLGNALTGLSSVFTTLAKNHLNVDIIIQSQTDRNTTNLSFSIKEQDLDEALAVLEKNQEGLGFTHIEHERDLAKVSIVGSGMISNPGVAAEMFEVLAQSDIVVKMVSTSEIKVSAVVDQVNMQKAAGVLHTAFKLDAVQVEEVTL